MSAAPLFEAEWAQLAAEVLGIPAAEVGRQARSAPFILLGGTSLRAAEFVAAAERRLRRSVNLTALLGPEPLAEVVSAATEAPERPSVPPPPIGDGVLRPVSAAQEAMVLSDGVHGGTAFHLLFSAEIRGPLDRGRLCEVLVALTRRHESLRSVFVIDGGEVRVRVLAAARPRLLLLSLPPGLGSAAVEVVHAQLASASSTLLRPLERPPVVFACSAVGPDHAILSLLVHHAVADGWSIGLLMRELMTGYEGGALTAPAPSPDLVVALEEADSTAQALRLREAVLLEAPTVVEIPSDLRRPKVFDRRGVRLHFPLTAPAREACTSLARACGLTRNAALLGAWALVLARRAGLADLLVGVSSASRPTGELHGVVGLCTKLLPVRCRSEPADTVRGYLQRLGVEYRQALDASAVPLERLAPGLVRGGDLGRTSLIQMGFAAHDELVPAHLTGRQLAVELHEGHCGGTVFDAILYVQRWDTETRLALEYATSVLSAADAAGLAAELGAVLVEMAAGLDQPLAEVRGIPAEQVSRLAEYGAGPAVPSAAGLWQLIEQVCGRQPDAVAVRDGERRLTYRQLRGAVERQSAVLHRGGVRVGDTVALAVDRSAQEIVSVLAVLRLGAAYVGMDAGAPASVTAQLMRIARPRAVLAATDRAAALVAGAPGRPAVVALLDPWDGAGPPGPPPAAPDPDRVAYVAFTSGSTGTPKGVRVPHRAVVRLARDPALLVAGAAERFLRLAPLAFDASTLEIFVPLVTGGGIDVYPGLHVVAGELADFVRDRRITGLWLTSGLFRLVADDQPDAFRHARQLLTGGDVVPPEQARRVLEYCPGLRLTNGYGPTENTTFTTVHHMDDPVEVEDPVPIGRPIAGTCVRVLDEDGRLLPPGAVGELCTSGDGLAVDYLDAPEETARSFVRPPGGARYYRTGDLVRWDGEGRLRYLGRRDHQVKVRGFRVELAAVAAVLRGHPLVQDAVVAATADPGDRRLVAGVVAEAHPDPVPALRSYAAKRLPGYAVPVLWAVVDVLPITANGKLDVARLVALARDRVLPPPIPLTSEEFDLDELMRGQA
jgi:amino acid adenylation domain-containing protein